MLLAVAWLYDSMVFIITTAGVKPGSGPQKFFCPQEIFGPWKIFGPQKFFRSEKIFGSEKIVGP